MFNEIPRIFQSVREFIAIIGVMFLSLGFLRIAFGDPEESIENLEGFLETLIEYVVPTEISWIEKAVNTISNPYVLLLVVIIILWLFGNIKFRR